MIFAILLVFSALVSGNTYPHSEVYKNRLPYFVVAVKYDLYEKCAGLLIAIRNVLVFDCDFLQVIDLEIQNITMKLNITTRKVVNIKQYTEMSEDGKMLPLYVLEAEDGFFTYISPVPINGGDLLEICGVARIKKFVLGFKENEILDKKVKPLPYEVCKRNVPEIKFNKRDFCVLDDATDGFIFESGSPLFCNECLTGLKLYSKPLVRKKNLTVHVFVKMTYLINWFMEDYGNDNPTWLILESDHEEKEIIGNQVRLEFRNNGESQKSRWLLSAQAILFHYLNNFINSSVFYY
uniref:Putative secreted protein n=1 Tax=Panstrongylus lignarius TaxID=156445 RepID=A0A224XUI0_9HEMI